MNYKIAHTMVGAFPGGRVVSEAQIVAAGYEFDRLVADGAIVPEEKAPLSTEPLPTGPHYNPGDERFSALRAATEGASVVGSREEVGGSIPLTDRKKEELLEIASREGVSVTSQNTKAEIIRAIEAGRAEVEPEDDDDDD